MTKKIKTTEKILEEYGYKIQSENPLVLVQTENEHEKIIGQLAQIKIDEIIYNDSDIDNELNLENLKKLKDTDYVLVTVSANYADEFDFSEFSAMTVADLKDIVNKLENYDNEIEWYFGTNEDLIFDDGKDLLSNFSYEKITEDEFEVLDNLFGGSFDGGSGVFDHIYELGDDDVESDDSNIYEKRPFFDKNELKNIDKLKKYGWNISVYDEENYLLSVENSSGEVSITDTCIIDDLNDYYKRNK